MLAGFLKLVDKFFPPQKIYAHCDIPCGIYDPHLAQLAAHTVIRMVGLISEKKDSPHNIARLTKVKEEHAELVKHEVRIIWGDYFKPEHLEKYPNLHQLVFEIMKLGSKVKQEVNLEAAYQLLEKVQNFAEIFWQTKEVETVKIKTHYPTEGEIVIPKA